MKTPMLADLRAYLDILRRDGDFLQELLPPSLR